MRVILVNTLSIVIPMLSASGLSIMAQAACADGLADSTYLPAALPSYRVET